MLARTYKVIPSNIYDPDQIYIYGIERLQFDLRVSHATSEYIKARNPSKSGGGVGAKLRAEREEQLRQLKRR